MLALVFAGCATGPQSGPAAARFATIVGAEEKSLLLDNFTAFVAAVNGRPVVGGRSNWDKQVTLPAGHCRLTAGFIRGNFHAQAELEFEAKADTSYQLQFKTDAELFGKNSFCDFWIVDLATGQPVTGKIQVTVTKGG